MGWGRALQARVQTEQSYGPDIAGDRSFGLGTGDLSVYYATRESGLKAGGSRRPAADSAVLAGRCTQLRGLATERTRARDARAAYVPWMQSKAIGS